MIGGLILVLLYVAASATPRIAPYGYAEPDFVFINQGPSLKHPMGTDELGRDELTRVIYGGRVSLLLGLGVGALSTIIGAAVGIISGFYGRFVDTTAMHFTDFTLPCRSSRYCCHGEHPQLHGRHHNLRAGAVVVDNHRPAGAREVLSVRNQEFVLAAKAVGVSMKITLRYMKLSRGDGSTGHARHRGGDPQRERPVLSGARYPAAHAIRGYLWKMPTQ